MKKTFALLALLMMFVGASVQAAWTESSRSTANSEVTLSTVTTRLRQIIDDPTSTSGTVRYTDAELQILINTGQKLMCINTMSLETSATQDLVAGTTEYLLPPDCMAVKRLTFNKHDDKGPRYFAQTTVFSLDEERGKAWAVRTSSPTMYYIRNRAIGMYPYPEFSGGTLELWYIKIPSTMNSDSDYIFDGYTPLEAYWHALAAYAAYHIFTQEGQVGLADKYITEFAGAMSAIRQWINFKPDYTPDMTGADNYRYNTPKN